MDLKEIVSRAERIRAEVNNFQVPIFYGSKVAPLKRIANDLLVLFRELTWRVDALESAKDKKSDEGNP